MKATRSFDSIDDSFSVDILLLLNLLLDLLGVKRLKHIGFHLKVLVELFEVPDEVLDCLALNLFLGEWHLKY